MNINAEVLSENGKYPIVKMPNRAFPGVLFQGDAVHTLLSDLKQVSTFLREGKNLDAIGELQYIIEEIEMIRRNYEEICQRHSFRIPY